MRTTCVGGVPRIRDTRVIRRVVHHATVVRVTRERLCRSQEEAVQGRVAAPWKATPGIHEYLQAHVHQFVVARV